MVVEDKLLRDIYLQAGLMINAFVTTLSDKPLLIPNKREEKCHSLQNLLGPKQHCEKEAFHKYHVPNVQQPKQQHHIPSSGY